MSATVFYVLIFYIFISFFSALSFDNRGYCFTLLNLFQLIIGFPFIGLSFIFDLIIDLLDSVKFF